MLLALLAVPVAVNVTGLPFKPVAVAVSVFVPATAPRVQLPTADATAKVTATPATGLPLASFTITDGAIGTGLPAVTVWVFPALTAICVALPATRFTGVEVAPASPAPENARVRAPTRPVIVRFVYTACPEALVAIAVVPASAGLPEARVAATAVPLWATAFPAPSWSWTIGWRANATPLLAVSDGWVTITSLAAGPAARVIAPDVTGARLAAVNVTV